jgi:hypothetical protein
MANKVGECELILFYTVPYSIVPQQIIFGSKINSENKRKNPFNIGRLF